MTAAREIEQAMMSAGAELLSDEAHRNVPRLMAMGPRVSVGISDVHTLLFVQPSGEFFALYEPRYRGEAYIMEALTRAEALTLFQSLPASNLSFAECLAAFGYDESQESPAGVPGISPTIWYRLGHMLRTCHLRLDRRVRLW